MYDDSNPVDLPLRSTSASESSFKRSIKGMFTRKHSTSEIGESFKIPAQTLLSKTPQPCYGTIRRKKTGFAASMSSSRGWSRNFVCIYEGVVYCYKEERSAKPNEVFSLAGYHQVRKSVEQDCIWTLEIVPAHEDLHMKTHKFAAPTESDRKKWITEIHSGMLRANKQVVARLRCAQSFVEDNSEGSSYLEEPIYEINSSNLSVVKTETFEEEDIEDDYDKISETDESDQRPSQVESPTHIEDDYDKISETDESDQRPSQVESPTRPYLHLLEHSIDEVAPTGCSWKDDPVKRANLVTELQKISGQFPEKPKALPPIPDKPKALPPIPDKPKALPPKPRPVLATSHIPLPALPVPPKPQKKIKCLPPKPCSPPAYMWTGTKKEALEHVKQLDRGFFVMRDSDKEGVNTKVLVISKGSGRQPKQMHIYTLYVNGGEVFSIYGTINPEEEEDLSFPSLQLVVQHYKSTPLPPGRDGSEGILLRM